MAGVAEDRVIDGRYRVKHRIGSGGMADVFCAEDEQLGREVALKVLHSRFARDADFVERFRREASSAARLQHPNVVNVFDRGDHDGTYYIAMEYLRGRSLKDLLGDEGALPQERALDLGIQILEAAGFAHARGVIHRDLKPHNVIVDENDTAKVTDFGIARAGASEMTETGSIMGTAQYLSPEQAQGHSTSPASDLYSIGIVLFEMLTGRLPFDGESAVSIALKHVSDPPPPLRSLNPQIHPAVEQAVMRALAKDPAQRFASAEEFIAALRAARDAVAGGGGQHTAVFVPPPGEGNGGGAPAAVAAAAAGEEPGEEERRRRRWPWLALAAIALALLALALWAATRGDGEPVPGVVGQDVVEASGNLRRAGFQVEVERRASGEPVNRVVDQDPDAGIRAPEGSTVTLVASAGPARVTVPEVAGITEKSAVRRLNRRGLEAETDNRSSPTVPAGRAIGTVPPAGTEVDRGGRVRLLISTGPRQVTVPDVVGLTRASAESRLDAAGFGVNVETTASDAPEGEVVAQSPDGGGRAEEGSRVTITVSAGRPEPETVAVPSVVGQSQAAAQRTLAGAGFRVAVSRRDVEERSQDGRVLSQSPSGGRRERGSTVTIVVGRFREPEPEEEDQPGEGKEESGGDEENGKAKGAARGPRARR